MEEPEDEGGGITGSKGSDVVLAPMGEDVQPRPVRDAEILVFQVLRMVTGEERLTLDDQGSFRRPPSTSPHGSPPPFLVRL
jgi:hypothetical protein